MGWSCSVIAGNVMETMTKKLIEQSGSQNLYKHNGSWYFWEISRRENNENTNKAT